LVKEYFDLKKLIEKDEFENWLGDRLKDATLSGELLDFYWKSFLHYYELHKCKEVRF